MDRGARAPAGVFLAVTRSYRLSTQIWRSARILCATLSPRWTALWTSTNIAGRRYLACGHAGSERDLLSQRGRLTPGWERGSASPVGDHREGPVSCRDLRK